MNPLTNAEIRELKGRAQLLEPVLKLGHAGASAGFLKGLDEALTLHGLVKVKFTHFKEEKKTIAPLLAEQSGSLMLMRVGNVAVYYRPKADSGPASS